MIERDANGHSRASGVPTRILGFECNEDLRLLFDKKDRIFREWRQRFDDKQEETSSHPLYSDKVYQEISHRIDELFASIVNPVFETTGMMSVVSGTFVFRADLTSPLSSSPR